MYSAYGDIVIQSQTSKRLDSIHHPSGKGYRKGWEVDSGPDWASHGDGDGAVPAAGDVFSIPPHC